MLQSIDEGETKLKIYWLLLFSVLHAILDMECHYLRIKHFVTHVNNMPGDKIFIKI